MDNHREGCRSSSMEKALIHNGMPGGGADTQTPATECKLHIAMLQVDRSTVERSTEVKELRIRAKHGQS